MPTQVPSESATMGLAISSRALAIRMALEQSLTALAREFMHVTLMESTRWPSAQALADAVVGTWNVAMGLAWHKSQRPAPSTCWCNRVRAGSNLVVRILS
jgi:hypothetical protein